MIRLPFRSAPRVPPLARDPARWFAPWLVALMVYVASLAGTGLILLDETLRAAETLLSARLTVQIPADASPAQIETILAALRQTQGVRSVHLLTPSEMGRLLESWLGSPVPLQELPVPRLIDAAIDPATIDAVMLAKQLASVAPDIRLDDYRPVAGGLRAGARPVQALLGAAIAGALLLVAALTVFATNAALAARRSDIEQLNLIGADDRQIARRYAVRWLIRGLGGGGIAAAAMVVTVAALGNLGPLIRLAAPIRGIGPGDWRLWAILAVAILAASLIAAASARATVRWRLARTP